MNNFDLKNRTAIITGGAQGFGLGIAIKFILSEFLWLAKKFNISRNDQDQFAYNSQRKAKSAQDSGIFKKEIVPVEVIQDKKSSIIFDIRPKYCFSSKLEWHLTDVVKNRRSI